MKLQHGKSYVSREGKIRTVYSDSSITAGAYKFVDDSGCISYTEDGYWFVGEENGEDLVQEWFPSEAPKEHTKEQPTESSEVFQPIPASEAKALSVKANYEGVFNQIKTACAEGKYYISTLKLTEEDFPFFENLGYYVSTEHNGVTITW